MQNTSLREAIKFTDDLGREITFRSLSVFEDAMLRKSAGKHSENEGYMKYALVASSIRAINGKPIPMPYNEKSIDAAIREMGDEGFFAFVAEMQRAVAEEEKASGENDADSQPETLADVGNELKK
jgi:hypothetical protein